MCVCVYVCSVATSRLSPSSEAKFQVSYKRQVKSWKDPFKRAVHCVLGHCDVMNNHSDVCVKTDDYMWLKVCWDECFYVDQIMVWFRHEFT